jgi:delta24-sterol reductase
MGVGMTTHSHVVGLYQEAVVCYEVILGDGSVVKATRDNEFHDLFHSLPWSHGTLGFLVGLELKIIPVKPFVHLKYIPLNNGAQEFQDIIIRYSGAQDKDFKPPHFLEMTVFSMKEAVLITGDFADVPVDQSHKINQMTKWWKPYFYKHVENKLTACSEVLDEYVPIRQYLLRHDKSIFWVLRDMIPFSENPLFIFLLGWALPPKPAFMKFTTTPVIRALTFTKQVFQDIVLPLNCLKEQLETAKDLFDIWPILVYPCKIFDHGRKSGLLRNPAKDMQCDGTDWAMFNDLGGRIWDQTDDKYIVWPLSILYGLWVATPAQPLS